MTVQDFVAMLGASAWQIVASVLAVITIWQAVRTSRFSKRLAKHEGSFDHPRLHIGIFGQSKAKRIIILAPVAPAPLVFPIPLNVRNLGTASARDVQILVRGNEDLLPYSREWLEREQPDASGVVVASFQGKVGHVNTVSYRIAHVHPGMPLNLIHIAMLQTATSLTMKVPAKTADGASLVAELKVEFTYSFEVVVFQENGSPIAEAFKLNVVDASKGSVAEALEAFWRNLPFPKSRKKGEDSRAGQDPEIENICVVTVDEEKLVKSLSEDNREVPAAAVLTSEGVLMEDGLFIPALGVALGSFEGALGSQGGSRAGVTVKRKFKSAKRKTKRWM